MSSATLMFVTPRSASIWLFVLLFGLELACVSGNCSASCTCNQVTVVNNAIKVLKAYYAGNYNAADQAEVSKQMKDLAARRQNLAFGKTSQCVVDLARCLKIKTADLAYCLRNPFKARFGIFGFDALAGKWHQPANCVDSKNWPKISLGGCE